MLPDAKITRIWIGAQRGCLGGGCKNGEKSQEGLGVEKSFIQYDEYFLSLARYQAELENNPNIPVTEL